MTDIWASIRAEVRGPSGAEANIAGRVLGRHVSGGSGHRPALHWRPVKGPVRTYTYADLDALASRFADGLRREGVRRGDTVTVMVGRTPELVVSVLGALRAGAVASVLFASYGPDPIRRRLKLGDTRVLVTTDELYRTKIEAARGTLPSLRRVLLVYESGRLAETPLDGLHASTPADGARDFHAWLARGDPHTAYEPVEPDTPALLHFTSGTTGEPKGVLHAHDAVIGHTYTARAVFGLEADTCIWCMADPGWVTGVSYGILGPLATGSTLFMDEADDEIRRWYENLSDERVEVWYTSPTALRRLRQFGEAAVHRRDRPELRAIFSVGEPLAAAEALWVERAFGIPVRDTWWQTETGCIVVATRFDEPVRSGRIGHALPAFEVATLGREGDGRVTPVPAGKAGELGVKIPWPSMFRTYVGREDLYDGCFHDGWYLSGDLAVADEHGWIRFLGRTDDVFKSDGHFVGPSEVEATLIEHEAVADAAVVGRDDPVLGTQIEAHLVLAPDAEPSDTLRMEILQFAGERLGAALAPRTIKFNEALPRTPSGKVARRRLRTDALSSEL